MPMMTKADAVAVALDINGMDNDTLVKSYAAIRKEYKEIEFKLGIFQIVMGGRLEDNAISNEYLMEHLAKIGDIGENSTQGIAPSKPHRIQ